MKPYEYILATISFLLSCHEEVINAIYIFLVLPRERNNLLTRVKEKSGKAGLKLNIQKTKIMASSSITSWQIDGEKVETVTDCSWASKSLWMVSDCSHEVKDTCFLEVKL